MPDDYENPFTDRDDDSSDSESEDKDTKPTSDAADASAKDSEDVKDDKRIRDLQSKADKAEARANKLQKELDEAVSKAAKVSDADEQEVPPQVRDWLLAAQERAQKGLYEQDQRFKDYQVPEAFITGDSPSKMKENAEALSNLVTQIEGQVRNKVLVEHGFAPEPATSERQDPKNYGNMSSEDFNKEFDKALGGGYLKRS